MEKRIEVVFEVGDGTQSHDYPADHCWEEGGRFVIVRKLGEPGVVACYRADRVICVRLKPV